MVETDDINERALLKRIFEQASHRRENPLSVSENINWYIDLANHRLENEPDVEILESQLKALDNQLSIEHDESVRREIVDKMNTLVDLPGNLRSLIREAKTALEHFDAGDIDRGLLAYDQMHQYRVKCNLPFQKEEFIHAQRVEDGGGKLGYRGPLYRMLECLKEEHGLSEPDQLLRHWIKAYTSKSIESKGGRKWWYKSVQIHYPEGEDSEHPRNFEYHYAAKKGNWKKATIDNIKITFGRVCDEAK